jgi:formate hydrogenlyase transcriptional activator
MTHQLKRAVGRETMNDEPTMHEQSQPLEIQGDTDIDEQERVDLRSLLLEVSRLATSHGDLQSLLAELVLLLQKAVRFDRLAVVLYDPSRRVMRLHTLAGVDPVVPTVIELSPGHTPSGVAWQTQLPIVISDLDGETRFPEIIEFLRSVGMRSFCVFPLTSPLRRLGALGFTSRERDAFREVDTDFLQQLTNEVALAVDNTLHKDSAELAERQLRHERDRLRVLLDINNALVSNLDPRALFGEVAASLRRVVPHDLTGVAVYDPNRDGFEVRALVFDGKGPVQDRMFIPMSDDSAAAQAFRTGKPVRLDCRDVASCDGKARALLHDQGLKSLCSLPMIARSRRVGTICVGRVGGEPFTDEDMEILAAAAGQIAFAVENALAFQEIAELKDKLVLEKVYLEDEIRTHYNFEEIVGESPILKAVLAQVETVGPTASTVLIRGETGTGKELIARAIHDLSPRKARTLVKINCASIPTGLLESELFGHERGAFTGAIAQKIGRFELADGGTLFLDEVGDIPLELQPKLLRVLQEQEFERLGSTRTKRVDVRIVAATNRSLEDMVAAGTFRNDLYYRLNVFPITLPSLRERSEDIPRLVRYFVQKFTRRMKKTIETIPTEAMNALVAYDWPGNVRELENAIERAVILSNGPVLHVPVTNFRGRTAPLATNGTLEATEREAILAALRESDWVLGGPRGAARRLGLKRTTLQSRMQKLGIQRPNA